MVELFWKISEMTRYFGVKCTTCHIPIALAVHKPDEGTDYQVPLESIPCPECGSWHMYRSDDCLFFDGPDGLPLFHPA